MIISEENFIEELRNRNERALDYLIDRYGNLLLKVSYSVLNNRESSMECVNDTLMKIWNNINCFNGEKSKFTTWIIVIAKRTAIDRLRKEKNINNEKNIENMVFKEDSDLELHVENKELREKILRSIDSLDCITKEIMLRRFFMEESVISISENLKISPSAVSNRIFKAKKKLSFIFQREAM